MVLQAGRADTASALLAPNMGLGVQQGRWHEHPPLARPLAVPDR